MNSTRRTNWKAILDAILTIIIGGILAIILLIVFTGIIFFILFKTTHLLESFNPSSIKESPVFLMTINMTLLGVFLYSGVRIAKKEKEYPFSNGVILSLIIFVGFFLFNASGYEGDHQNGILLLALLPISGIFLKSLKKISIQEFKEQIFSLYPLLIIGAISIDMTLSSITMAPVASLYFQFSGISSGEMKAQITSNLPLFITLTIIGFIVSVFTGGVISKYSQEYKYRNAIAAGIVLAVLNLLFSSRTIFVDFPDWYKPFINISLIATYLLGAFLQKSYFSNTHKTS